jgi:hypothetical protein
MTPAYVRSRQHNRLATRSGARYSFRQSTAVRASISLEPCTTLRDVRRRRPTSRTIPSALATVNAQVSTLSGARAHLIAFHILLESLAMGQTAFKSFTLECMVYPVILGPEART